MTPDGNGDRGCARGEAVRADGADVDVSRAERGEGVGCCDVVADEAGGEGGRCGVWGR